MANDYPTQDILLDYVRDRLPAAERQQLEAAAAANDALAAEITALRNIRAAMQQEGEVAWSSELGWARLSRAIRLETNAGAENMGHPGSVFWWKVACLVLAVVAAAQFVFASNGASENAGPRYEMAGAGADRPLLRATFLPDAREADIRALIRASGGEMVGGPSAQGLYDIGYADVAARDRALAAFQARSELVTHVQAEVP